MRVHKSHSLLFSKDMNFGKQKFDVKQVEDEKFMFNVKQLKMSKYMKYIWQWILVPKCYTWGSLSTPLNKSVTCFLLKYGDYYKKDQKRHAVFSWMECFPFVLLTIYFLHVIIFVLCMFSHSHTHVLGK